ncbi:MAG: hypothetical protein EXR93_06065 [Gemmatimonadetes bacterium]|nr:hypothetical protein [Gemmatimonadota bacterium]
MSLSASLERLHARVVRNPLLQVFTATTRGLLAMAFVPSGLTKVMGERFTSLGTDTSVGYFFDAMYQTGYYYRFLGASQVLAAILLLFPATATLGAVMYFPIILNIFIITVAVHFTGTPFITGLMMLGSIYLLCWDYDRLRHMLPGLSPAPLAPRAFGVAPTVGLTLAVLMGTFGGINAIGMAGPRWGLATAGSLVLASGFLYLAIAYRTIRRAA